MCPGMCYVLPRLESPLQESCGAQAHLTSVLSGLTKPWPLLNLEGEEERAVGSESGGGNGVGRSEWESREMKGGH